MYLEREKPRISFALLVKDKEKGGWGVTDIRCYHKAIILSQIVEWAKNNKEKRWVKMDNTISKAKLGKIIWIPPLFRKLSTETHIITRYALKVWDNLHKKEKWEYNSPLIPL